MWWSRMYVRQEYELGKKSLAVLDFINFPLSLYPFSWKIQPWKNKFFINIIAHEHACDNFPQKFFSRFSFINRKAMDVHTRQIMNENYGMAFWLSLLWSSAASKSSMKKLSIYLCWRYMNELFFYEWVKTVVCKKTEK